MYQEHVRGSHYKKSLLLESEKSLKRQEERESKSRHSSMASLGEKSRNGSTNHVAVFAIPSNHHNVIGEEIMNPLHLLKSEPDESQGKNTLAVSMQAMTRNDICSEPNKGTGVFGNSKRSRALESQVVKKSILEHALLED